MCVKQTKVDPDRLQLRGKKGIWRRFAMIFFRFRMPWWLWAIYIVLNFGTVNLTLDVTEYSAQLFAGDTSPALITKLLTVVVINMLLGALVAFLACVTRFRTNQNMRDALIKKIMRLPMSYFKQENPRDAIFRITDNAEVVSMTIMMYIIPIFTEVYRAVEVFRRISEYDIRLCLVLLVFIPLRAVHILIFGRIQYALTERNTAVQASLIARMAEMITNIPLAKAFGKEDREAKKGTGLTGRLYKVKVKTGWLQQLQYASENLVKLAQTVVVTLVALFLLKNGSISTEAWVTFFMFSWTFDGAVGSLLYTWQGLKKYQGTSEKIAEIMDAQEEDLSGEPCQDLRGDLELKSVRFGYEEGQTVLAGTSCVFPDNCVTALLGASGCGKTTITNLLTRLYTPQEGEITVAGKSIHGYALRDYRSQFVVVSQDSMLFSGTIRENVCYGNGAVTDEELKRVLKQARAYDFVMSLPDGLDTRLEEYGKNLSGGQRQRLIMARALLSKARYFILDEPVAAMDAIAASELMEVLGEVSKDRCVIIIAHTAAVLSLAKRVVVVEDGVVTAQGSASEAAKHSQFLRQFSKMEVAK